MKQLSKALLKSRAERRKPFRWSLRNWIQTGIFVLTILIGFQFAWYVRQVARGGPVTIPRPPGVEGFLPIGSLMGWKYFFLTGIWDHVHPAGMVILGFAVLVSWGLRKSFCGWFCPVGTLSEWLWRTGRRQFGKNSQPPAWIDIPLRALKYLLLTLFVWAVAGLDAAALERWFVTPYWKVSDIKMLHFFTRMSLLTAVVLLVLVLASLFIRNFWCRYLCPYGALVGLFALVSPARIRRRESTCIDCALCARVCPAYLPVDKKPQILSAECTGCLNCVEVCPVKATLELKMPGLRDGFWTPSRLGLVISGGFLAAVLGARLAGLWTTSVPLEEIRSILPEIDFLMHP